MKTSRADEIRKFILENVDSNPNGIATQTAKKFRISRPGVHRHINSLLESGHLAKIGHRRKTRYARTTERQQIWVVKRSEIKSAPEVWEQTCAKKLRVFKSNVIDLLQWGFCQVLQNALEHTQCKELAIFYEFSGKSIHLSLLDDGMGIFESVSQSNQIADLREAALKIMNAPFAQNHSGPGLAWCAKLFDSLLIRSNGLEYCRFGNEDWYLDNAPSDEHMGTLVQLSLDIATTRTLASVLQPGGGCPADRQHVFVKMLELKNEVYLTREDAQNLLFDLDGFKEIVLDFKAVRNVGYHFTHEIFCFYQSKNPEVEISYLNTNSNIKFMIERCQVGPLGNHTTPK